MTVFVGGSRRISRLNDTIRSRADNIVHQKLKVVIGDANGADKAMQQHFAAKDYKNVVVYCMGKRCRNNLGSWPTRYIYAERNRKDFAYYATKDLEMAKEASGGFMIWDGKSKGTLNNIQNLMDMGKKTLVYFAPEKAFHKLSSQQDLEDLLRHCDGDNIHRAQQRIRASLSAVHQ